MPDGDVRRFGPRLLQRARHVPRRRYGSTLSRADGMFDMAVNGGGLFTLEYTLEGYAPAQRQVRTMPQDYAWASDLAMVHYDLAVTPVGLSAGSMAVAQGTAVTDA